MPDRAPEPGDQPADHVGEAADVIAAFQEAHEAGATPLHRAMETVTVGLSRPLLVSAVIATIVGWTLVTLIIVSRDVTNPSFTWLELLATLFGLVVAMLILVTQRREDQLSERRAKLTLELAIISDRKISKVIALLEELRHDHPGLRDRNDAESAEMAKPTDANSALEAIERRTGKGRGEETQG